ncbi:MAG: hypothetical protein GY842_28905 [bacterium]|nr:hypothetical protein [bacterium]
MRIERVGEVEVWWIERPGGARVAPRVALSALVVIAVPLVLLLWWLDGQGERWWPWTTVVQFSPSLGHYVLRYLLLLGGAAVYVVGSSALAWRRLGLTAQADLDQAQSAADGGRWSEAAVCLHRYGIMRSELGRQAEPRAQALDRMVRPHLGGGRRLYVYHRSTAPPVPETPSAGFQPQVVPISVAGGWWIGLVVAVLAIGALAELRDALVTGVWSGLLNVNFVAAAAILAVYAYVSAAGFLGRRSYFRFAPGTAELLRFRAFAASTHIDTIPLRECDVFLDVTGFSATVAFVERSGGRVVAEYHLSRSPRTLEICFRAVLSAAPVQALPERELTS